MLTSASLVSRRRARRGRTLCAPGSFRGALDHPVPLGEQARQVPGQHQPVDHGAQRAQRRSEYHLIYHPRAARDRLEDVPYEAVGELPAPRLGAGHKVENYEIVMRGVCAACQRR